MIRPKEGNPRKGRPRYRASLPLRGFGTLAVPRDLLSRGTVAHLLWATLRAYSQSLAVLRRGIGGGNVKPDVSLQDLTLAVLARLILSNVTLIGTRPCAAAG